MPDCEQITEGLFDKLLPAALLFTNTPPLFPSPTCLEKRKILREIIICSDSHVDCTLLTSFS